MNTTPQQRLKNAVLRGDVNEAKAAIVSKADPFEVDVSRDTLLHLAVDRGHVRMAEMLCAAGVPVDAQNYRGRTAMHEAMFLKGAEKDRMERVLLAANARLDLKDEHGLTAQDLHEHLVVARARQKWAETHSNLPTQHQGMER